MGCCTVSHRLRMQPPSQRAITDGFKLASGNKSASPFWPRMFRGLRKRTQLEQEAWGEGGGGAKGKLMGLQGGSTGMDHRLHFPGFHRRGLRLEASVCPRSVGIIRRGGSAHARCSDEPCTLSCWA